jgi:putative pyruvate formate lyase activating enzyme
MEYKSNCTFCPRKCRVNRDVSPGFCQMGTSLKLAKAYLHRWEEPCISGVNGSGTVFFSGCNLKCVYCQNHTISHENYGVELSASHLGKIFLSLQDKGAHNINLVSPSHFVPQINEALDEVSGRLKIPVVYNSNGYDSVESLRILEGKISVYLPDFKYFNNETSKKYSYVSDYLETVTSAICEMYRQVGNMEFDEDGILKRGVIIRHLILPGHTNESIKIIDWIRSNLPKDGVLVSLMSQYTPLYKASCYPELNRRIIRREYQKVVDYFMKAGFNEGYIQERDSAQEKYVPDFDFEGLLCDMSGDSGS